MDSFAENEIIKFWFEGHILCGFFKKDAIIGLDAAKEAVALRLKFCKGGTYKGILYLSHISVFTAEARAFLASPPAAEGFEKVAIIANTPFPIIMINLFISLNKLLVPVKLFKSKDEALKWLNAE